MIKLCCYQKLNVSTKVLISKTLTDSCVSRDDFISVNNTL